MRILVGLLVFTSCWSFAQNTTARAQFEVVDIRPNKSGDTDGSGTILPSGQFRAVNMPIKEIIKFAYNIRDENIVGAPTWISSDRYDIVGKAPAVGSEEIFWRSTSRTSVMTISYGWDEMFRQMTQTMLADRFKLVSHQQTKSLAVFALVVAKGGELLKPSSDTGRPGCTRKVTPEGEAEAVCTNMKMGDLAHALQAMAPGYADRNVVDLTGLTASYDFTITWVARAISDQGGQTIPGALEKQLGVKLEARTLPIR
jgi:uncharacterized protein (TIGR03435 family)